MKPRRNPGPRATRSAGWHLVAAGALVVLGGCHIGAGPVVGYAPQRGVTFGWQAGGALSVLRGEFGQSFRAPSPEQRSRGLAEWPAMTYGVVGLLGRSTSDPPDDVGPSGGSLLAGRACGAGDCGSTVSVSGFTMINVDYEASSPRRPGSPTQVNCDAVTVILELGGRIMDGAYEIYFAPSLNKATICSSNL